MRRPVAYRIHLSGKVSNDILRPYLHDFEVSRDAEGTILTGLVRDAAHLHGIVSHLTSLGLELVSVNPAPAPSSSPER